MPRQSKQNQANKVHLGYGFSIFFAYNHPTSMNPSLIFLRTWYSIKRARPYFTLPQFPFEKSAVIFRKYLQPIGEVLLNHIGECCIHCQTIEFIAKNEFWPIDCQLWFRVIWYILNSWSTCCAIKHQFPLVNAQSLSKMSGFRTNAMQPSPKLFGMVDVTMMWRGRIDFSP